MNPGPGVAVRVIVGALLKADWHVPLVAPGPMAVQLIPLGLLVTTPIPPPPDVTVTCPVPGTYPTQPAQVMIEMTRIGIKDFPALDILLTFNFAGSNFDEQRADLVGFLCCARRNQICTGSAISFTCEVMVISEQSAALAGVLA